MKNALLLVDIQNDFLPGGALAIPNGDHILPAVKTLLDIPFDLIVASQDWHPKNHSSFAANHPGKSIGDHVIVQGLDQNLWPIHCVQGTSGAEFSKGFDTKKIDRVFQKGKDTNIDSYSAFFDNGHFKETGLGDFLKDKGIENIYIAGLATDYCVKFSTLDALKLGFNCYVVVDACRGVNLQPHDGEKALEDMQKKGASAITTKEIPAKITKKSSEETIAKR